MCVKLTILTPNEKYISVPNFNLIFPLECLDDFFFSFLILGYDERRQEKNHLHDNIQISLFPALFCFDQRFCLISETIYQH